MLLDHSAHAAYVMITITLMHSIICKQCMYVCLFVQYKYIYLYVLLKVTLVSVALQRSFVLGGNDGSCKQCMILYVEY